MSEECRDYEEPEEEFPDEAEEDEQDISGAERLDIGIAGVAMGCAMATTPDASVLFAFTAVLATAAALMLRRLSESPRRERLRLAYSRASTIMGAAGACTITITLAQYLISRA